MGPTPVLHLLVGPNGAGKSTLARTICAVTRLQFVNADEIAQARFGDDAMVRSHDAAEIAQAQRDRLLAARTSFVSETVASHPSKAELVAAASAAGYLVTVHAILIPRSLPVRRVASRIAAGGHDVPAEKVLARYDRGCGGTSPRWSPPRRRSVSTTTPRRLQRSCGAGPWSTASWHCSSEGRVAPVPRGRGHIARPGWHTVTIATGQHQADEYLRELRRAARVLPRRQRTELLAEIEAHLIDGLAQAESEAAVRNLLEDLGDPGDIVGAALPPGGPPPTTGALALVLGLVGVGAGLVPFFGVVVAIPLGIVAVVLGTRARRDARSRGNPMGIPTSGVVAGVVAMVVPLLMIALVLPWGVRRTPIIYIMLTNPCCSPAPDHEARWSGWRRG